MYNTVGSILVQDMWARLLRSKSQSGVYNDFKECLSPNDDQIVVLLDVKLAVEMGERPWVTEPTD